MFQTARWHIGQSHVSKQFTALRFFTDVRGRNHAEPLLDAATGKAALFATPALALASAAQFDRQALPA